MIWSATPDSGCSAALKVITRGRPVVGMLGSLKSAQPGSGEELLHRPDGRGERGEPVDADLDRRGRLDGGVLVGGVHDERDDRPVGRARLDHGAAEPEVDGRGPVRPRGLEPEGDISLEAQLGPAQRQAVPDPDRVDRRGAQSGRHEHLRPSRAARTVPSTAGEIVKKGAMSAAASWSKVTSIPVRTGTPVVASPGSTETTCSGARAWKAHEPATVPSSARSVNR